MAAIGNYLELWFSRGTSHSRRSNSSNFIFNIYFFKKTKKIVSKNSLIKLLVLIELMLLA